MIWLLIAVIATLVALGLILPVMRRETSDAATGLSVFSGQREELRRDVDLGLVERDRRVVVLDHVIAETRQVMVKLPAIAEALRVRGVDTSAAMFFDRVPAQLTGAVTVIARVVDVQAAEMCTTEVAE